MAGFLSVCILSQSSWYRCLPAFRRPILSVLTFEGFGEREDRRGGVPLGPYEQLQSSALSDCAARKEKTITGTDSIPSSAPTMVVRLWFRAQARVQGRSQYKSSCCGCFESGISMSMTRASMVRELGPAGDSRSKTCQLARQGWKPVLTGRTPEKCCRSSLAAYSAQAYFLLPC